MNVFSEAAKNRRLDASGSSFCSAWSMTPALQIPGYSPRDPLAQCCEAQRPETKDLLRKASLVLSHSALASTCSF